MKKILAVNLLLLVFISLGAAVIPVPFGNGANSFFHDETAGDKQGGWSDQGSNDLRLLPTGNGNFGGVPFRIASDADGKSCIVLGGSKGPHKWMPHRSTVPTSQCGGRMLYLLHGVAYGSPIKADSSGRLPLAGRLTVRYSDGTSSEFRIRQGRDVADWWSQCSFSNAHRAWTKYNNNGQVSLFASKFKLERKPITALEFDSSGAASVWMIAAAAVGDDTSITNIPNPPKKPTRQYNIPPADHEAIGKLPTDGVPRNIILIIGDGMGFGCLDAASLAAHGRTGDLLMQKLPVKTDCRTSPDRGGVTDSAASATAIAGGYKTVNGRVGMTTDKKPRITIAEAARDSGRSVGLVTTDSLQGATPAGFMAHVPGRGDYDAISVFAAKSRFDVLIGNFGGRRFFLPGQKGGSRADQVDLLSQMKKNGYVEADGEAAIAGVPDNKHIVGFPKFDNTDPAAPSRIAGAVFERLDRNPRGFFVMVECSWPDYGGHGNNPDLSVFGGYGVDFIVRAALDFAMRHPDTLIVVTADHETGGVTAAMPSGGKPGFPEIFYTSVNHTGARVPFFAIGPGAKQFAGKLDNTMISRIFADMWNLKLEL